MVYYINLKAIIIVLRYSIPNAQKPILAQNYLCYSYGICYEPVQSYIIKVNRVLKLQYSEMVDLYDCIKVSPSLSPSINLL